MKRSRDGDQAWKGEENADINANSSEKRSRVTDAEPKEDMEDALGAEDRDGEAGEPDVAAPIDSLPEDAVGIEVFLRPGESFTGILKQRYSDFVVREIDDNGQVTQLTDLKTIPLTSEEQRLKAEEAKLLADGAKRGADGSIDPAQLRARREQDLSDLIGSAAFNDVKRYLSEEEPEQRSSTQSGAAETSDRQQKKRPKEAPPPLLLAVESDKARRSAIHAALRVTFGSLVISETDAQQRIVVKRGAEGGRQRQARGQGQRAAGQSAAERFTWAVLYKENRETLAALRAVAAALRVPVSLFAWAGTKDKRAVTTQLVSCFKIAPDRLAAVNARLPAGLRLGNFRYSASPLRLGALRGNRFDIVLRHLRAAGDSPAGGEPCDANIEAALKHLCEVGFVNYFGMQRFGSSAAVPTHHVGRALLRLDWAAAARLVLAPRPGDHPDAHAAREYYARTGDVQGTLQRLPRQLNTERMLLRGLGKSGDNAFLNAFANIPRNLRMLYVHAYQSYVWNAMASERIRRYGSDRVVPGDLVLLPQAQSQQSAEPTGEEAVSAKGPPKGEDEAGGGGEEGEEGEDEGGLGAAVNARRVHVVADAADAARFAIGDVLLPLVSATVQLPTHAVADFCLDLLRRDGLTLQSFSPKQKLFQVTGGYRRLIERPRDVRSALVRYDDVRRSLLLTDSELLEQQQQQQQNTPLQQHAPAPSLADLAVVPSEEAGRYKALVVSFSLPAGCYATMCLRELMRTPTHFSSQQPMAKLHATESVAIADAGSRHHAL